MSDVIPHDEDISDDYKLGNKKFHLTKGGGGLEAMGEFKKRLDKVEKGEYLGLEPTKFVHVNWIRLIVEEAKKEIGHEIYSGDSTSLRKVLHKWFGRFDE